MITEDFGEDTELLAGILTAMSAGLYVCLSSSRHMAG
jgi:hypothetical protein